MFPQTINAMYQFYENEIGKFNWTVIMTCLDLLAASVKEWEKILDKFRKRVKEHVSTKYLCVKV